MNNQAKILTIKEYDKLYIRQNRDLNQHCISMEDAKILQSLIIDESPVLGVGNRYLFAKNLVGIIALPEFTIEILPKLYGHVSTTDLRKVLVTMLLVSRKSPSIRHIPSSVAMQKNSLVEILIETFLEELKKYVEGGLQKDFVKVSANIAKIKGRILFNKHINKNMLNPCKFYCSYSEYISDTHLNQFLKTCMQCMLYITRDESNKSNLEQYLELFAEISDYTEDVVINYNIEFNLLNVRAKKAYDYGRLFLENFYSSMNAGQISAYTMLFDMNIVFQEFIYSVAKQLFGNGVRYQKRFGYVLQSKSNKKNYICMKPDLIVSAPNGDSIIIDTKWKIPKSFVQEADVYQMNAYVMHSDNINNVVLLYPNVVETNQLVGAYEFLSEKDKILYIKTVDLMEVLNWVQFIKKFKEDFFKLPD